LTRKLLLIAYIALLANAAFPHGNEQHVMGTVTQVSQGSVTVQTFDQTLIEVKIVSDTKFTKNNTPAELKDLHVGDRVVIHAKKAAPKDVIYPPLQMGLLAIEIALVL
jgi:hypothetical protein